MHEIRVPATSANLGPGFDCLGLALGMFDQFSFEPAGIISLEGADPRCSGPDNLFAAAFRAAGGAGIHVSFDCAIPAARGLGSSAALTVAGILAARILNDEPLRAAEIFDLAARLEGHPDNAAPAVYGGLTGCLARPGGHYQVRSFSLDPAWHFTALIPDLEVATAAARKILPDTYDRQTAAHNGAKELFMARALADGDRELLREAAADQLHEPYRRRLIPHFSELKSFCELDGQGTVVISGSGPACLYISRQPLAAEPRRLIGSLAEGWQIRELPLERWGAAVAKEGTWQRII